MSGSFKLRLKSLNEFLSKTETKRKRSNQALKEKLRYRKTKRFERERLERERLERDRLEKVLFAASFPSSSAS